MVRLRPIAKSADLELDLVRGDGKHEILDGRSGDALVILRHPCWSTSAQQKASSERPRR